MNKVLQKTLKSIVKIEDLVKIQDVYKTNLELYKKQSANKIKDYEIIISAYEKEIIKRTKKQNEKQK